MISTFQGELANIKYSGESIIHKFCPLIFNLEGSLP